MSNWINGGKQQSVKSMLQNPQVRQQIKNLYAMFNGDQNALVQYFVQSIPQVKNNPMLSTIIGGGGNADDYLKQYGICTQDIADIVNGQ